jgi:uncharacterized membrane protein YcjF (UPF0283 family)
MSEEQALDRLHAILARPDFRGGSVPSLWEQIQATLLDWLFNQFAVLWQSVRAAATGQEGWLGLGAIAVAVVVIAAVALYLVRSVRLAVLREGRLAAEIRAERRERSDQLWSTAQALAARGDWPGAVRAAYLSALYALDEHALLHVQTALTNREHATELARAHPELGSTFAELVRAYDRLRYGREPITAQAFADLSHLVAQARELAPV